MDMSTIGVLTELVDPNVQIAVVLIIEKLLAKKNVIQIDYYAIIEIWNKLSI